VFRLTLPRITGTELAGSPLPLGPDEAELATGAGAAAAGAPRGEAAGGATAAAASTAQSAGSTSAAASD
jgi:hypothetical protein